MIVKGASMPDDTNVMQNSVTYLSLTDAQADRSLFFEAGEGLGLGELEDVDRLEFQVPLLST